jgi:hypothetical protein
MNLRAILLFAVVLSSTQSTRASDYEWRFIDGQLVSVPKHATSLPPPHSSLPLRIIDGKLARAPVTPVTQVGKPITQQSLAGPKYINKKEDARDLGENFIVGVKIYMEGSRIADARKRAEDELTRALTQSDAKYAIVPVSTDTPLKYITRPEDIDLHHYKVGTAETADSRGALIEKAIGPRRAELRPASASSSSTPHHLSHLIVGEKRDDGTIDFRNLDKRDLEDQAVKQAQRDAAEAKATRERIEREKIAANEAHEKALDEAALQKKAADEIAARMREHERQQKERDEQLAEAAKHEEAVRKGAEALEQRAKERDDACRAGQTPECITLEYRLSEDVEKHERSRNTAMCAKDEDGMSRKGRCGAQGGCMYCTAGANLKRAQKLETLAGVMLRENQPSPDATLHINMPTIRSLKMNRQLIEKFELQHILK